MANDTTDDIVKNCSLTLLQHLGKAKHIFLKSVWICFLLIALIATMFQSSLLLIRYSNFEKLTSVQLIHNVSIRFPAVTICNLNPYKASAIKKLPEVAALLELSQSNVLATRKIFTESMLLTGIKNAKKQTNQPTITNKSTALRSVNTSAINFSYGQMNLNQSTTSSSVSVQRSTFGTFDTSVPSVNHSTTISLNTKKMKNVNVSGGIQSVLPLLQTSTNISFGRKKRSASGTTACPMPDSMKSYFIQSAETGLFLDIDVNSSVVQNDFEKNKCTQHWIFVQNKDGTICLLNRASKKAMTYFPTLFNVNTTSNIMESPFIAMPGQKFQLQQNDSGCRIRSLYPNINTNLTLSVSDVSTTTGADLRFLDYLDVFQEWLFVEADALTVGENILPLIPNYTACTQPDSTKFYRIILISIQLVLETNEVHLENCDTSQHWFFEVVNQTSNVYKICNRKSKKCLRYGSSVSLNTNVNQSDRYWQVLEKNGACNFWHTVNSTYSTYIYQQYTTNSNYLLSVTFPSHPSLNYYLQEIAEALPDDFSCPSALFDFNQATSTALTFLEDVLQLDNITDDMARSSILSEALMTVMSSLSEEQHIELGYQPSDLNFSCKFNNKKCDFNKEFVKTNSIQMGNCYTFNHRKLPQQFSIKTGLNYGLKIFSNVSQNDYMSLSLTAGVKVYIDDFESPIFMDSEGVNIAPGFTVDFQTRYSEINRLSLPYGNCTSVTDPKTYFYNGTYSYGGCIRSCLQLFVLNSCGCGDVRFALPTKFKNGNATYCTFSKVACVRNVTDGFSGNWFSSCNCQLSCLEKLYVSKMSISKRGTTSSIKQVSLNRANSEINVYFNSFTYSIFEESPDYEFSCFLADFGGISGNNLDASFITMFEVMVLILLFLMKCCKRI